MLIILIGTVKQPDGSIVLPNQPIILICQGEDRAYDSHLAYWPSTREIGHRVLDVLDDLREKDMDKHISVVDYLVVMAHLEKDIDTDNQTLALESFGVSSFGELGRFMILREPIYGSSNDRTPTECIVEESSLSPFLYHFECDLFY